MSPRSLLAAVFAALAMACAGAPPAASEEERFGQYIAKNRPSVEHEIFAGMVGRFAAEVRTWPAPGADPVDYDGLIENQLVLGGRFLQSRYRSDLGEQGVMEGLGLLGYNTFEERYESFWADTFATILPPISHGHVEKDGRELHFASEGYDPMAGKVVRGRSVVRLEDRRRHSYEMYAIDDDGHERLQVRISYTRL